jgi:MOSC domain-containing protein YiiM
VHRSLDELSERLARLRPAPTDEGTLQLIVRRPARDEREVVESATVDANVGLVGDTWAARPSRSTGDGSPDPRAQITLVEVRVAEIVADDAERWPLFGDQLFVDLDLSERNLPPGTSITIGSAELVVTDKPHKGCAKFASRFGTDALRAVMSPEGRRGRFRGANASVARAGTFRTGDAVIVRRAAGPGP